MLLRILFLFLFTFISLTFLNSAERQITYNDIPLLINETTLDSLDSAYIKLEIFDPQDTVLWPENLPFYGTEFFPDLTGELSFLAKTDSFSGAESIALAKRLAAEYGIISLELIDTATTLQCPLDGTLCKDESLHSLRSLGIFKCGQGFYEKEGAIPVDGKCYRCTSDFLFSQLQVSDILDDLKPVENQFYRVRDYCDFLRKILSHTHSSDKILFSELFQKITALSQLDHASHFLWHQFMDRVIAQRDSFFVDLVGWIFHHKDEYDPRLLRLSALTLYEYVAKYTNVANNNQDLVVELFSTQSSLNLLQMFQKQHFFTPMVFSLTYSKRATEPSKTQLVLNYVFPFRGHGFREAFQETREYLKLYHPLTGREPFFNNREDEFIALLNQASKRENTFPPGHFYLLFEISKILIDNSPEFIFTIEQ